MELLTEAKVEEICAAAKSVQDMGLLDPKRHRPSLVEYLEPAILIMAKL